MKRLFVLFLFPSLLLAGNSAKVGKYLDCLTIAPDSDLAHIVAELDGLSLGEKKSALSKLQPSILNGLILSDESAVVQVRTAASHRMALLHGLDCKILPPGTLKGGVWFEYFEQFIQQSQDHGQPQFSSSNRGIVVGADYEVFPELYFGTLLSYTHCHVHWHNSIAHGQINNYYGGLYTSWSQKLGYVEAAFIGSGFDDTEGRRIKFDELDRKSKGSFKGYVLDFYLGGGLTLHFSKPWENEDRTISELSSHVIIQFFGRLDYLWMRNDGFKERGAHSLNLNVHSKIADELRSEIGIKLNFCEVFSYGKLVPDFKLSYVNETRFGHKKYRAKFRDYEDEDCVLTATAEAFNRNLFNPEIGLTLLLFNEMLGFSLYYEAEVGQKYSQQEGSAHIEYRF